MTAAGAASHGSGDRADRAGCNTAEPACAPACSVLCHVVGHSSWLRLGLGRLIEAVLAQKFLQFFPQFCVGAGQLLQQTFVGNSGEGPGPLTVVAEGGCHLPRSPDQFNIEQSCLFEIGGKDRKHLSAHCTPPVNRAGRRALDREVRGGCGASLQLRTCRKRGLNP